MIWCQEMPRGHGIAMRLKRAELGAQIKPTQTYLPAPHLGTWRPGRGWQRRHPFAPQFRMQRGSTLPRPPKSSRAPQGVRGKHPFGLDKHAALSPGIGAHSV